MAIHSINYISLFSGYAGLDLAVRAVIPSARCICYVENEAKAAELLVARSKDGSIDDAPIDGDIRCFDGEAFVADVGDGKF